MNISSVQAMGLEYVIAAIGLLLARKAYTFRKNGMNYFWRFMVVLNLFLLINIPIRLFELQLYIFPSNVVYWLYAVSLVFMTFSMFYWFLFMLNLLDCKLLNTYVRIHIAFTPALLIIPLCIINRWTGWLYYIQDSVYYRGPLFILQGFISYLYMFINLAYVIYCLIANKNRKYAQLGLYVALPVFAGIVLQILFGGSFLLGGIVICASVMYIDICLEKQKDAEVTKMKEMFVQTAETLASAIDAKDEYTHGHSTRVAQYSRMIAEKAGYPSEYVEMVYFSGLLHDVGKIGVSDEIINKKGKLTNEEFSIVKSHSMKGREILAHIRKLPYLTMGAKYHHERYDGLGYPEGLKATDIPDIARIIAVADAYDAMTSIRSYRNILSQKIVREEIRKGSGKQFDPVYAAIMIDFIDQDKSFSMKQNENQNELYCREYYKSFYEGVAITPFEQKLHFQSKKIEEGENNLPTIVLFDSVDTRIHIEDQEKFFYSFAGYCDIRTDGKYKKKDARKMEVSVTEKKPGNKNNDSFLDNVLDIEVSFLKRKDHIYIKISDGFTEVSTITVLPDSSRFAYIGLTGKDCHITDISIENVEETPAKEQLKRITDEIKYFDKPDGDIPNIQIDSWRTESTKGIPVPETDELKVSFYMKSLEFSHLIWHCPFLVLFDSEDGYPHNENCREYGFVRFDGEAWQSDPDSINQLVKTLTLEFKDWNSWKQGNKNGRWIEVSVKRNGNQVFMKTACGGIELENTTTINSPFKNIYFSLSGDQVVLESIKFELIKN